MTLLEKDKKMQMLKKENEIEETLSTVSYKDVKESKKEANVIGDSDQEQLDSSVTVEFSWTNFYIIIFKKSFYRYYFISK